jgi:hypothetical protein
MCDCQVAVTGIHLSEFANMIDESRIRRDETKSTFPFYSPSRLIMASFPNWERVARADISVSRAHLSE